MSRLTRARQTTLRPLALLSLIPLAAAGMASASDGVTEINQVCAEQAGCVAGDAIGFPVTISRPGSYRLTSNLEVEALDSTAITVAADDVTIDLSGFTIRNRVDCRPDCGAPGSGSAIDASGRENLTVRGGTIIGMGSSAIRAGDLASVIGVKAIGLGGSAIVVGNHSEIRGTSVHGAAGIGLSVGHESAIADSLVRGAGDEGIRGGASVLVSNSRVIGNGDTGIRLTGARGAAIGNVISGNGGAGAWMQDGLLAHNVVSANQSFAVFMLGGSGGVVRGNQITQNASGVDVTGSYGTVVTENSIVGNAGSGILGTAPDGIAGNVIASNGSTIVGGNELGENACDGNTTCP